MRRKQVGAVVCTLQERNNATAVNKDEAVEKYQLQETYGVNCCS